MAISESPALTQEARTRRLMRIRQLDPQEKCGHGTTVTQLYLVDQLAEAPSVQHLVFFDRHGWYCVHGRDCPAVEAARRSDRSRPRVAADRTTRRR